MGVNWERAWNVKWREEKEKLAWSFDFEWLGTASCELRRERKVGNSGERWVMKHESLAMEFRFWGWEGERVLEKKN